MNACYSKIMLFAFKKEKNFDNNVGYSVLAHQKGEKKHKKLFYNNLFINNEIRFEK